MMARNGGLGDGLVVPTFISPDRESSLYGLERRIIRLNAPAVLSTAGAKAAVAELERLLDRWPAQLETR
ncbi:MAG: hypothetical protein JWL65_6941 [Gammaproteobacteria bacterium]|nr:hypothetical protein [Gammaproteobacteria bacterium]